MTRRFGRFLRRNTIALLALFVALSGTTFAAANFVLPKNSVGTAQIKNGAVTKKKINKKTVRAHTSPRNATFLWPWAADDAVGFAKFTFVR